MDDTPVGPAKLGMLGRLEQLTLARLWSEYRLHHVPREIPDFVLERLRESWVVGAASILLLAERLGELPGKRRRTAILRNLSEDAERTLKEIHDSLNAGEH